MYQQCVPDGTPGFPLPAGGSACIASSLAAAREEGKRAPAFLLPLGVTTAACCAGVMIGVLAANRARRHSAKPESGDELAATAELEGMSGGGHASVSDAKAEYGNV